MTMTLKDWARRAQRVTAPVHGYDRLLYAVGLLLLASSVVHLAVFAVDGGPWGGAVSWRKPAVFAFSFGTTSLSIGWALRHMPCRPRLGWTLAATLAVSGSAEVALVTLQQWRGVASHFNTVSSFDLVVFAAMGGSIVVFTSATVVASVWCVKSLRQPAAVRLAVLSGMALLLVGQGLGGPMIAAGLEHADVVGAAPESVTIGAAGVGKVAHAVALHGLQVLGFLAVLLQLGTVSRHRQQRLMRATVLGYGLITVIVTVETFLGHGPLAWSAPTMVLLAAGVGTVIGAYGMALLALRTRAPIDRGPTAAHDVDRWDGCDRRAEPRAIVHS